MYYAKKITFLLILVSHLFIFQSEILWGASLSLESAQQIYQPGDTILITADINNNYNKEIDIILECHLTSVAQKNPEIIVPVIVTLGAGESKKVTLFEMNVTEDFPSDEYRAVVNQTADGIRVVDREVTFFVQQTLKQMEFAVHLCEDLACTHESVVFSKGKELYINYESDIADIRVEGDIYFREKLLTHLVLPAVFQTAEAGSYLLMISASKEGYTNGSREINFAVIEKELSIAKTVVIDIKPGSYPNSINLKSNGVIPVAIITAKDFDAANSVEPYSVRFADAITTKCEASDVNYDGIKDLLLHFKTQDLNLTSDSTEASLTAVTYDGLEIEGKDQVNIVPKGKGNSK